jgi:hypothetical protein
LVGSSLPPTFRQAAQFGNSARRTAAALIFPISYGDMQNLAMSVLVPQPQTV